MDTGRILEQIRKDAAAEAEAILEAAREKAGQLKAETDAALAERREKLLLQAKAQAAEAGLRAQRMDDLEDRKNTLALKRELLDRAFARALELLEASPPTEARRFFRERLMASARGDETLLLGSVNSAWMDDGFLREVNGELSLRGLQGGLRLSEEGTGGMGFALVRGGARMECTFGALLEASRLLLEPDAADLLFS